MTAAIAPLVLVVEDTLSLQMAYRGVLSAAGYRVAVAPNAAEALRLFTAQKPDLVLLDLVLPDRDGLALMQDLQALHEDTMVVVMTAHGSVNKAVAAMRAGAQEFLVKPFDEPRLLAALDNVLGTKARRSRRTAPTTVTANSATNPAGQELGIGPQGFLGTSPAMQRIHDMIASVARSMATVFITGESGTGKELCALAVHGASPRAKAPFIALNCGAIPEDLLESEVFGHMKGSFTGAISDKQGAAAAADGGTLFLDEVCEMAPALQTKLLRFLQTSTVVPVGAIKPRKVNVRIICATNRDPLLAVRAGQFREDLYYRLFVVPIHMPPLRDRGDDVLTIAEAALTRFAAEEGKRFDGFNHEVRALFRSLSWPGNVRQVLNVIRNIVVLNSGGLVGLSMLPETLFWQTEPQAPLAGPGPETNAPPGLDGLIGQPLAAIERQVIEATLARFGGSVPRAARVLELSPSTLYRKIDGWTKT